VGGQAVHFHLQEAVMKRILFVLVSAIIPAMMFGQTELIRATDGSSLTVEVLIPNFKEDPPGLTFSGMTILISGKAAISDMVSLNVELPSVQSKLSSPFGSISKSSLANIYLGAGIGPSTGLLSGEFGVRFMTLKKDNSFAGSSGAFGDFPGVDRYFAEDNSISSIRAGVNFQPSIPGILSLQIKFAPALWIPKAGDELWVLNYGVGTSYDFVVVKIAAGINGITKISKEGWFWSKNAMHHFQVEANARFGIINPGVMFRVPLDKELDATKFTLGFYVGFVF
jgi:hypothetical protein